jgi:pimeloyl-ACP methyl ester carboxylesterase
VVLPARRPCSSKGIDLDTQITDIVNLLHYEDLRDVILAGHSYGGMVITGAADRAGERIGKLVYLDSVAPPNGVSLADIAGVLMEEARADSKVVDGVELVLFPDSPAVRHYGVTDPDDFEWMVERLTPHPWKCFEQPITLRNEAAIAKIPTYTVICTSRFEMPGSDTAATEGLIAQLRAMPNTWLLDTGHDLMITEPQATADILLEIANG